MKKYWYESTIKFQTSNTKKKGNWYNDELRMDDCPFHLLLAREVYLPIIKHSNLDLWRFHRLVDDSENPIKNIFKFKYYASKDKFKKIHESLQRNLIIQTLKEKNIILSHLSFQSSDSNDKIGSDRDIEWPYTVSKGWPYLINGVCRCWLEMVDTYYNQILEKDYQKEHSWKSSLFDLSKKIENYLLITELIQYDWGKWGYHFAFHHTNHIYGSKIMKLNFHQDSIESIKRPSFIRRLFMIITKKKYRIQIIGKI